MASMISFSLSFGKDLETASRWMQPAPELASLAFLLEHANKKGVMKCGRRRRSFGLSAMIQTHRRKTHQQ